MKKLLLVVNVFTLFLNLSNAQSQDSIDIAMDECINSNTAFYDVIMCLESGVSDWDDALNNIYRKLIGKLDKEKKQLLIEAQRKWIAFRDAEEKFAYSFYDRQGKGWDYDKVYRRYDLTRSRTIELRTYYSKIYDDE